MFLPYSGGGGGGGCSRSIRSRDQCSRHQRRGSRKVAVWLEVEYFAAIVSQVSPESTSSHLLPWKKNVRLVWLVYISKRGVRLQFTGWPGCVGPGADTLAVGSKDSISQSVAWEIISSVG